MEEALSVTVKPSVRQIQPAHKSRGREEGEDEVLEKSSSL